MRVRPGRLWAMTVALVSVFSILSLFSLEQAQSQPKPASPPPIVPLAWTRAIEMPDGRRFVTDGAMAIDAKVAKPAEMPKSVMPVASGKIMVTQMTAPFTDEVALNSLRPGTQANTFVGPRGISLSSEYVSFLRRVTPAAQLRFAGPLNAVVIVVGGQPVGMVMPRAMPK